MAYPRNITLFSHPNINEDEDHVLPNEVIQHLSLFLDEQSIGRSRLVCKHAQSSLARSFVKSKVFRLLKYVMWGEIDKAESLIRKLMLSCPNDYRLAILQKSHGIEHCDREWKAISPLEFAAQAGDKFMLDMLIKYISHEYKKRALCQLKQVLYHGTEHGEHLVSLGPLLEAYEKYNANYSAWSSAECKTHWIYDVGGAQAQLPLPVLQDFFSHQEVSSMKYTDRVLFTVFYNVPTFDLAPNRICQIYDGNSITPNSSGLGNVVAMYRCEHKDAYFSSNLNQVVSYGSGWELWWGNSDLAMVRYYCKVRTEDLANKILRLESELKEVEEVGALQAVTAVTAPIP